MPMGLRLTSETSLKGRHREPLQAPLSVAQHASEVMAYTAQPDFPGETDGRLWAIEFDGGPTALPILAALRLSQ